MKKISFATNTGPNTLEYTKLLLKSLKENLDYNEHEIIVFIDKDNDGTLEYLRSIKNDFHDLKIITHNVTPILGPERNPSVIVDAAKHDIVSYLQSDMVVSKHYDTEILKHLEHDMILSSTRIEPPLHGESSQTFTKDFGLSPDEFKSDEFLQFAETVKTDKIIDYFFAPFTFYKQTWDKLGGYDTNFRRSRCDSDIVQRSLHLGIQIKQTFAANVYHFTCVSSRGKDWFKKDNQKAQQRVNLQQMADQVEIRRFIRKWGNFNHGDSLLFKYDIDFVVLGDTQQSLKIAYELEPFGSRMWIENEQIKSTLLQICENEHQYANELYEFTDEDWKNSYPYYNHTDFNNIYHVGKPNQYNIKIEIDPTQNVNEFFQNVNLLNDILETNEPGDYELGGILISIKQLKKNIPSLHSNNPDFDMNLINIE
jgi:hypothetical protein